MTAAAIWNANDYAQNSAGQARFALDLIDKLALRPGQSVLDIGCGDGKITHRISQLVHPAHVVGIDASASMIDYAQSHHVDDNLTFHRMDAMAIDLTETFDLAFSNAVLHWVPDHIAVLRGVKRVLKPGGKVLFQMGGAGNAADIIQAIAEVTQQAAWREYFVDFKLPYYFFDTADYQSFLNQCGFKALRLELLDRDMAFSDLGHFSRESFGKESSSRENSSLESSSAEKLQGWLRSAWFPVTDRVPEHLRSSLLRELVSAYQRMFPEKIENGSIRVAMKRLEVQAVTV